MKQREAETRRKTNETEIFLSLNLDGQGAGGIDSGVGFLNHMLDLFKTHSGIDLSVVCHGDTEVDAHHSVEDIAIALGETFKEALGDRKGIERFADCVMPMDETAAQVAIDLSGRGYLVFDCPELGEGKFGDFDTELVEEFFRAFCYRGGVNAYVKMLKGGNRHHQAEAIFKGFARCIKKAIAVTGDRVPSSKGVLE
jgi:imidazoleglycerol-phosphate dehydratase